MTSRSISELWTDGITEAGASRRIAFHFSVMQPDGSSYWYYFGTIKPDERVGEQRPVITIPADLLAMPAADIADDLYNLAVKIGKWQAGITE